MQRGRVFQDPRRHNLRRPAPAGSHVPVQAIQFLDRLADLRRVRLPELDRRAAVGGPRFGFAAVKLAVFEPAQALDAAKPPGLGALRKQGALRIVAQVAFVLAQRFVPPLLCVLRQSARRRPAAIRLDLALPAEIFLGDRRLGTEQHVRVLALLRLDGHLVQAGADTRQRLPDLLQLPAVAHRRGRGDRLLAHAGERAKLGLLFVDGDAGHYPILIRPSVAYLRRSHPSATAPAPDSSPVASDSAGRSLPARVCRSCALLVAFWPCTS